MRKPGNIVDHLEKRGRLVPFKDGPIYPTPFLEIEEVDMTHLHEDSLLNLHEFLFPLSLFEPILNKCVVLDIVPRFTVLDSREVTGDEDMALHTIRVVYLTHPHGISPWDMFMDIYRCTREVFFNA